MKPIIVTAAIIFDNDKVLITQRKAGKNEEFKWEFPGGKLEDEETPEECLAREIKEELNLNIEALDIFKVIYHKYTNITILLLAYKCRLINGEITAVDCNDFKWVSLKEFDDYDFAAADKPIIEKIKIFKK